MKTFVYDSPENDATVQAMYMVDSRLLLPPTRMVRLLPSDPNWADKVCSMELQCLVSSSTAPRPPNPLKPCPRGYWPAKCDA